jgi:hypothetical protein
MICSKKINRESNLFHRNESKTSILNIMYYIFWFNVKFCQILVYTVELVQSHLTPVFSDILWHPTKIYGLKVFLLTKIKPVYSDIPYNLTHFSCPLVCQIRQVPLYIYFSMWMKIILSMEAEFCAKSNKA